MIKMMIRMLYVGVHQPKEIVEVDAFLAKDLLLTGNYELLDKKEIISVEDDTNPPPKFDFDNDGDVDSDDYSLAGKALADARKKKK